MGRRRSHAGGSVLVRLVARDGPDCYWCHAPTHLDPTDPGMLRTRDHLLPRSEGGSDALVNQVVSCRTCNAFRGTTPVEVWEAAIDRALTHPVDGQPPAITARGFLTGVDPARLPGGKPGPRSEARRRKDRRRRAAAALAQPAVPLRAKHNMGCAQCGATWNVRWPVEMCRCPGGPVGPWPPPDPEWVPGTF